MLITVTGSNLLDVRDMDNFRAELDQHVARATDHPETAVENWPTSGTRSPTVANSCSTTADLSPAFDIRGPSCCRRGLTKTPARSASSN